MEDGPSGFQQGFSCPAVLGCLTQPARIRFVYGAITLCGPDFHHGSTTNRCRSKEIQLPPVRSHNPEPATPECLHRLGLGCSPFARRYSGNRFCFLFLTVRRWFSSHRSLSQWEYRPIMAGGFPHSEISGSKPVSGSPKLIAAIRVLHRLLAPRHPPCALISLITRHEHTQDDCLGAGSRSCDRDRHTRLRSLVPRCL